MLKNITKELKHNPVLRGKWDKVVKQAAEEVILSKPRRDFFHRIYHNHFENEEDPWKNQEAPEEEKTKPDNNALKFKVKLTKNF